MKRILQLLIVMLLMATKSFAQYGGFPINIDVNGVKRNCPVYVPQNIEKNCPLLIALHGRWGDGMAMANCTHFEVQADTARFIVACPDGLVRPELGGGNNTGWDANGMTDDDVEFFKKIIDYMSEHYDIDRKRVYLCGFSLGGMMTYHCINVASDIFAAFASASGYRLNEYKPVYTCKRRVPILHIHGKDDGFVVYNNLQPLINNWVKAIGANPEPEVTEKKGVYTRRHYKPLEGGYEFDFYSLDGYGHEYKNTENFNESDVIWNFLRRYSLDTPPASDSNFQVYLCFGQSNMEGNAQIEEQDKTGVDPRFMSMYTLDNAQAGWTMGKWHTATPPQARPSARLSVVDYFGRKMVEKLPEEVKVGTITVAVGGASIDLFDKDKYQAYLNDKNTADWLRNSAKEYGDNPYGRLIELAKLAQKKGVIKGILLHQGETSNCDPTWPSRVKKIYEDLLSDLGLNADEVPLLVGELGQKDQGAACWGHNSIIDNISATIPTALVVSSKDCPLQDDHLHFTAEGYRMFGKRYADVMLDILGVSPAGKRNYFIRYESTAGENLWDRQAIYTLPQALEKGAKYSLTMKVRTSADCAELGFWPIWNASDNKNQWGGSDDVQYLAAYPVEAGGWKTLTWNFTANFALDTFQFVFGKYAGTLDIDDLVLVKEGTSENLIANADFSAKHIQGWSTNWNGPSYSLANEAQTSTGIFTPSLSVAKKNVDPAYYTLQGMKLLQKPTKAGIYIHHGKKMRIAK